MHHTYVQIPMVAFHNQVKDAMGGEDFFVGVCFCVYAWLHVLLDSGGQNWQKTSRAGKETGLLLDHQRPIDKCWCCMMMVVIVMISMY